jgi:hypothetical protein
MARTLRTFVSIVVLALAVSCARPPDRAPLLDRWVTSAGADTEQPELVAEVLANREAMERQFIEAFRNGPGDARREVLEESVARVWSLAQVQLAEPDVYGLDDGDIAEMKSLSLDTEKRRAWERLEHNFKAAALLGLGITQGSEAKAVVAKVAADKSSPFWMLATNAFAPKKPSR